MEKVKISYSSGWMLTVPKYGNGLMLFFEWLSEQRAGKNIIHKVIQEDEVFKIRLNISLREQVEDLQSYINNNL